jgi:hypothetical protein
MEKPGDELPADRLFLYWVSSPKTLIIQRFRPAEDPAARR